MTLEEIQQLEDFFTKAGKQPVPIYLNQATEITDYDVFLQSHFQPLKANPNSKVNQPLLYRLKALKLIVEANA
ncbi:hypothetical protein EZ449_03510 [Pedobacter frigidisoli]|uniref:DUF6965 domain-containing protein n=1 Tax=Pedobacter frigidisoli TaxID=2530455 RepID=A0A4R0P632_9SPHI|nr:hypothetical protein [Pedobacter frigidisoli]TCD12097.1 hypothetical protein EZ449_03510 [Pedobacter frigidisoli]